jgi:hypothetical protein
MLQSVILKLRYVLIVLWVHKDCSPGLSFLFSFTIYSGVKFYFVHQLVVEKNLVGS